MIKLGQAVTDNVTGFTGIVTARAEYLHGTPRALVEPTALPVGEVDKKGRWIDEGRLRIQPIGIQPIEEAEAT